MFSSLSAQLLRANLTKARHLLCLAFLFGFCVAPSLAAEQKISIVYKGVEKVVSLSTWPEAKELKVLRVKDAVFDGERTYHALSFHALLNVAGVSELSSVVEIKFVCADGYVVTSPSQLFQQVNARPYIALRSAIQKTGDLLSGRWEPYQQGAKTIGFDPAYLVWQFNDTAIARKDSYPWPYQIVRIELLEDYSVPDIGPSASAPPAVHKGFESFSEHCMRCHQVQGVGGNFGPNITRRGGMLAVLTEKELLMLVSDVKQFYPRSAMPVFKETLPEAEIQNIVKYLMTLRSTIEVNETPEK